MNERQAFLAIRNAVRLENLAEDVAKRVSPELRAIFDELGRQFRSMPPGNIEREIWYRQQRMRIADFFVPLNEEMRESLTAMLDAEVVEQMNYAEQYLNAAIADPADQAAIIAPQDGISTLGDASGKVQFTRQQLHTIAEDSRVLGDKLSDLFRPSLDSGGKAGKWIEQNLALIDRKIKAGFLTGMTNDQIAATLPGLGREAVRRNKAIARTAVMDMSARSQEALWAANSDRIKGWEFDATMDNRVCEQCAPWDGQTQETRGRLPSTPIHVNCRCRVLPLTATELALREEEGPQRRSVVELIEADSKEAAIAKAKLKPGVVDVRAYAKQVTVKGKKYWRVAEDIQRSKDPLTMGEFLRQASPATQEQVLGSGKRRRMFMEKITGTANRPPISPDRALKEVTEWQPTVTRRPRLSMDMRLDISKLKSQKELMKKNSEGEQHVVYGYLRAKDSGTGKAGSPYYVGIGDSYKRAYEKHFNRRHSVPVPKDKALIRQLGTFKTRAEAEAREIALVKRYGRQHIDKGGILLNRQAGGGKGNLGYDFGLTKTTIAGAKKVNMPPLEFKALSNQRKYELRQWLKTHPGKTYKDFLAKPSMPSGAENTKLLNSARKLGLDPSEWAGLGETGRRSVLKRIRKGASAQDALLGVRIGATQRQLEQAREWGISIESFLKFSAEAKNRLRARYKAGKRGAALLEGLL